jgi:hypothetical protein
MADRVYLRLAVPIIFGKIAAREAGSHIRSGALMVAGWVSILICTKHLI